MSRMRGNVRRARDSQHWTRWYQWTHGTLEISSMLSAASPQVQTITTQVVLPAAPGAGAVTGVLSGGYPAGVVQVLVHYCHDRSGGDPGAPAVRGATAAFRCRWAPSWCPDLAGVCPCCFPDVGGGRRGALTDARNIKTPAVIMGGDAEAVQKVLDALVASETQSKLRCRGIPGQGRDWKCLNSPDASDNNTYCQPGSRDEPTWTRTPVASSPTRPRSGVRRLARAAT